LSPNPQSSIPGIHNPVGSRRRTEDSGERKSRRELPENVSSDDPDDDDYVDGSGSLGDIDVQPRPTKRRKQPGPVRIGQFPQGPTGISPVRGLPFLDLQTIARGVFTCEIFPSEMVYSLSWREDRDPSCDVKSKGNPTDREHEHRGKHAKASVARQSTVHMARIARTARKGLTGNTPFSPEEDALLRQLKERDHLTWSRIATNFPGRTKGSLQVRYSMKLKDRTSNPSVPKPTGIAHSILDVVTSEPPHDLDSRPLAADGARDPSGLSTQSLCHQRYGPPRSRRVVDRYSPV
jgi:hypothetical protein